MSDFTFFLTLLISTILFGAIIGAYYGTAEYRIRTGLPLVTTDCICPSCRHRLSLHHQIPIAGFLLLKGKCHFCHAPIPVRYPLTESIFLCWYVLTYCIFHRMPLIYLPLWYLFVCSALIARSHGKSHGHYRPLLKGILIMTIYHLIISLLYIIVYMASYNTLRLG